MAVKKGRWTTGTGLICQKHDVGRGFVCTLLGKENALAGYGIARVVIHKKLKCGVDQKPKTHTLRCK